MRLLFGGRERDDRLVLLSGFAVEQQRICDHCGRSGAGVGRARQLVGGVPVEAERRQET